MAKSPVRLASTAYEKVWGSPHTEPWYGNPEGRQIGEVWFAASTAVPLLVKFLFTSDNLSVQVHPEDDYAREHHDSRGKTEMWHVLRADTGAKVALGLKEPLTEDGLRQACETGAIVDLVNWVPARAGDTFFTPAGTIHAIGAGLALCEIQQHSDVTYRLYDYNRPNRELHLDHGIRVSHRKLHHGAMTHKRIGAARELLADCQYFRTERLRVSGTAACEPGPCNTIYVALEGEGTLAGLPFRAGEAWEVPTGAEPFEISSGNAVLLITSEPNG